MPISFQEACKTDNDHEINHYLENATPTVPIEIRNDQSLSGLMMASEAGTLKVCKVFLKKKCDLEAENVHGRTALFFATYNGHTKIVEYLFHNKANITRPAWAGFKTAEEGRTKIMYIYT